VVNPQPFLLAWGRGDHLHTFRAERVSNRV
jgi:hypothetical protein